MRFAVVFCAFLGSIKIVSATKCDTYVDITDGNREGTNIIKDGVLYTQENYFEVGETIQGCICQVKPCVRRCCEEGEALNLTTRRCAPSTDRVYIPGFSVTSIINVPENKICDDVQVKIKINEDFTVVDGVLIWEDLTFSMDNYCLAVTPANKTYAIACVVNEEAKVYSIITCLGNYFASYSVRLKIHKPKRSKELKTLY